MNLSDEQKKLYQELGRLSVKKRLGNLTTEQKSEYFKKVRKGLSPK